MGLDRPGRGEEDEVTCHASPSPQGILCVPSSAPFVTREQSFLEIASGSDKMVPHETKRRRVTVDYSHRRKKEPIVPSSAALEPRNGPWPAAIDPTFFHIQLSLSANHHGFSSLREVLLYSHKGNSGGAASQRCVGRTSRARGYTLTRKVVKHEVISYRAIENDILGSKGWVYFRDRDTVYAACYLSSTAGGTVRRLESIFRFLRSVRIRVIESMGSAPSRQVRLLLEKLGVDAYSADWRILTIDVPFRPLHSVLEKVLSASVEEEPWPTAFELCDLRHDICCLDIRKDRLRDLPVDRYKDSILLRHLLPASLAETLPESDVGWTYIWDAQRWVPDMDLHEVKVRIFERKRLARLLTENGLRDALYRSPLGYLFKSAQRRFHEINK